MRLGVFQDVLDFHHKMQQPVSSGFTEGTIERRRKIMDAEWQELLEAMQEFSSLDRDASSGSPELYEQHVAQELVDVLYVVLGTFVELGIDPTPVWTAVHGANMEKVPNPDRLGLKALKPAGWQKPEIRLVSV